MNRSVEQWCKQYVCKWLHVEQEPPEGWVKYCLYKLYFRWRRPLIALQGLRRGPSKLRVIGHVALRLDSVDYTHPVTNDFTDLKLKKRIAFLQQVGVKDYFNRKELQELMPSINNIRVIACGSRYKLCDGHGRIYALRQTHPNAYVEVDVVEAENSTTKAQPQLGDLRIRRRFAATPVEAYEGCGGKIWLQVYYSLERYEESVEEYSSANVWAVVARIPEKNIGAPYLLIDPDPTMRKFAQMLVHIKGGNEVLIIPEEVN